MAVRQDLSTVPQINTPPVTDNPVTRVASPDGYFPAFGPRTPSRSASQASLSNLPTTPVSLLRAGPREAQLPSRTRPRADNQAEYSTRSARSNARINQTASPDILSATLSPSIASHSSGGGSLHSSELANSLYSLSSSDLLTPPVFQADCDKRPYKPRQQSKSSLTMVTPRRVKSPPHGKPRKYKRQHQQKHNFHHSPETSHRHRDSEHWWIPGCAIAPAAPKGMKELCEGHVGRYRPFKSTRGNTDTYGRVLPRLWSDPAPPLVTRRWSSVEIGSHQIHFPSKFLQRSALSTPGSLCNNDTELIPHKLSQLHRSSTFIRSTLDYNIIHTIRQKLTLRKVPSAHFQTPTTITLRRASETRARSGASTITGMITQAIDQDRGGKRPLLYPRNNASQGSDTAYIITRQDIDSITELIEENLWWNYQLRNQANAHPLITAPSVEASQSPNFTLKCTIPTTVLPTELADSFFSTQRVTSQPQDSFNHLQVALHCQKMSVLSRASSLKSTHEVIWEANGSPISPSDEESHKLSPTSEPSSQEETVIAAPQKQELEATQLPLLRADNGDAFDPNNANESINEWSWKLSLQDIPVIATLSDSESNDLTPSSEVPRRPKSKPPMRLRSIASAPEVPRKPAKFKSRRFRRPVGPVSEILDVVSFPPLPRKETKDWYSPLPNIGSSPPRVSISRSLYDEGIDATGASSIMAPISPSPESLLTTAQLTPPLPSIEFDPEYDIRCQSFVKVPFLSPAPVDSYSSMGSSIGAYSGERRKSSINAGVKRVRTIDNIHKGERVGTWTRNRPPSLCPSPKPPSPTEAEEDNSSPLETIRPRTPRSGVAARLSSIHEMRPPFTKVDRAGIYGKITGTLKSALGLDDCLEECPPHICGDCMDDPRKSSVDLTGRLERDDKDGWASRG